MKKTLFFIVAIAFACVANAQFTVGASFNLQNSNYVETMNGKRVAAPGYTDKFGVFVSPNFGYRFNERWEAGLFFEWSHERSLDRFAVDDNPELLRETDYEYDNMFYTGLYGRYVFLRRGHLSLFCEGWLELGFGKVKEITKYESETPDLIDDTRKLDLALTFVPGVNYAFNEHFSIDLYVTLFSVGYDMFRESYTYKGKDYVDYSHKIGLLTDFNDKMDWFMLGFNYLF